MNFENIVRYLDNDAASNTCSAESGANKELKELYDDAKRELADLEVLEKKGK